MNKITHHQEYLVIDWGTTNLRIFLLNKKGKLLTTQTFPMGLLQVLNVECQENKFATTLVNTLSSWIPYYQKLPIYMAGMIGSANGWHEIDYIATDATLENLINNIYQFELPWGTQAYIVPGIIHSTNTSSTHDVMRGEEVQVFGLLSSLCNENGLIILPGTHSKHVSFSNQKICSLATFTTGEIFSIIKHHSILTKALPEQYFSTEHFLKGVAMAQNSPLTQILFQTRTQQLFNSIEKIYVESFLSGLLIGYELNSVTFANIYLVGEATLCDKYYLACNALNIKAKVLNGNQCFLNGMKAMINKLNK